MSTIRTFTSRVLFAASSVFDLLKATSRKMVTIPGHYRDGQYVDPYQKMVHYNPDVSFHAVAAGHESASHSQKAAHRELSGMDWWNTLSVDDKALHVMSMATDIQNKASAQAAVSVWKRDALLGKNPKPAMWAAFLALPGEKQAQLYDAVRAQAGGIAHLVIPQARAVAPVPTPPVIPPPVTAEDEAGVAAMMAARGSPSDVLAPEATPVPPTDMHYRLAAVPHPDLSVLSDSETNQGVRRRVARLHEMAAAGDRDGIESFTTSRSRSNYAIVADYRDALLVAATTVPVAQIAQAMASPLPAPPVIAGRNEQNTALLAARRKVRLLHEAARSADPVAAILAIPTSRGNGYLNQASDYKQQLLTHFGCRADGSEAVHTAEIASLAHPVEAAPVVAPPADVVAPVAPIPAPPASPRVTSVSATSASQPSPAPTPPAAPVTDSQNPLIAANPLGLSEDLLGFVPRPNVPLSTRTNDRAFASSHPSMAALNRRYLAQSVTLQQKAREYQSGQWVPETPASRAASALAAAEASRREMAASRAAAAAIAARMANVSDLYKPRAAIGANVAFVAGVPVAARFFGVAQEEMEGMLKTMVADYGGDEKFSILASTPFGRDLSVQFTGDKGTSIVRKFAKTASGEIGVYHSYFEAGNSGGGSGKNLFRCSMGVYHALGVTNVTVTANIDVGGYAWARFGYLPVDWIEVKAGILERMDRQRRNVYSYQARSPGAAAGSPRRATQASALPAADYDRVMALLQSDDPKTLWAFVDMEVGGRKIGKELMLGCPSWRGKIDLSHSETMDRFDSYISSER